MSAGNVEGKKEDKPVPHSNQASKPWEEGTNLYEVSLQANPTRRVRANDKDGARGNYMAMLGIRASEHEIKVEGPINENAEKAEAEKVASDDKARAEKSAAETRPATVDNALLGGQRKK